MTFHLTSKAHTFQRSLTVGNIALKKEHIHLETSVKELAAQINLGLIGFL
jgi:hypothetical protein